MPEPYPDEILVEVKVCNNCTHWDFSIWEGKDKADRPGYPKYPQPVGRPGHEWAGVVVAKGDQVTKLNIGDRVAYWGAPPNIRRLRARNQDLELNAYAQYVTTHEDTVFTFPEGVPWPKMAMLEMLSASMSAVTTAGDVTGKRVAVTGLGPAGLMILQGIGLHGPAELIGIDLNAERCGLAKTLGADTVYRPGTEEWDALPGNRFDYAIDATGMPAAVEGALARTAGTVQIFSIGYHGGYRVPQNARQRRTTIVYPGTRPGRFSLNVLMKDIVNVECFLAPEMPIEEYAKGIELLYQQKVSKIPFVMD
jgi:threonine dehydrogenase-like Zn-dependent dehydrogenase